MSCLNSCQNSYSISYVQTACECMFKFGVLDSLYRRRIAADYHVRSLSEVDLSDSLQELDDVVSVLAGLGENGAVSEHLH